MTPFSHALDGSAIQTTQQQQQQQQQQQRRRQHYQHYQHYQQALPAGITSITSRGGGYLAALRQCADVAAHGWIIYL
jgi:hypothetical protein